MSVKLFNYQIEIPIRWWTFPGGERSVKIEGMVSSEVVVHCCFKGSNDLIDMLLLVNAVRYVRPKANISLFMPYFPFARQDRVMTSGEPFALQVAANLAKSCNFDNIEIWDAHSDVLQGMFEPGVLKVVPQWELHYGLLEQYKDCALVSPDAGAIKKVYKTAQRLGCPVIEASKQRNVATGEIVATKIDSGDLCKYNTLIVVDDICDGGRTFIELGKEIRKTFQGQLVLCVTHGIFSKGIAVFNAIFSKVLYINDMRSN